MRRLPLFIRVALINLAMASGLPGCGGTSGNSPTSPSTINLTGTWSGDFVVQGTTARMTWTLIEANGTSAVTGPVILVLPDGTVLLNGALSGTLSGSTLTFAITVGAGAIPSQPLCTGELNGSAVATINSTSTLVGSVTVAASSCAAPVQNGPLTLVES